TRRLDAITLPWSVVARDHRFAYVVVVSADQPTGMPAPVVPLEPRSVSQLRGRLEQVERELEELDYRRIGLTFHRDTLRAHLDGADDRAARQRAAMRALERDQCSPYKVGHRARAFQRYFSSPANANWP